MRSAHHALSKIIDSIPAFEFKDPQEDPSGFIAWMWQSEPREKHQENRAGNYQMVHIWM